MGSLPSAYLLVKWKSGLDIRNAGSGNVGTLNSLQVTGSRLLGVLVLVLDFIKGLVSVALASALFSGLFPPLAAAGIGAVIGHNFPIWLKFKGGRGLATAAGVMSVMAPVLIAVWGVVWGGGFLLFRKVNVANVLATLLSLVAIIAVGDGTLIRVTVLDTAPISFRAFGIIVYSIILLKHINPIREFVVERTKPSREEP